MPIFHFSSLLPGSVASLVQGGAAVFFLAAVFLVVELAFRVYLFGLNGLTIRKIDSVRPLGRTGLIQASAIPEIVYELVPNQDTWFKLARFRTNSEGLADHEYSRSKPEGTFRIAVLGSSFSMPSGVALKDAWHKVLESSLNARGAGRYEVINFSVGGYDPRQLLATLKYRAVGYDPDLILVDVTLKSPWILRHEEVYKTPFIPRTHGRRPFWRSFALDALLPPSHEPEVRRYLPRAQSRAQFKQILVQFGTFARTLGRPLCFVLLQHDRSRAEETSALRGDIDQAGACVIDTFPAFAREKFSDLVVLKTDDHPNARAQKIFAQCVLNALVRDNLVGDPP